MDNFTLMLVILAAGLGTFALRYSFIYLLGRVHMPVPLRRAMRFVPAAVLAALVLPALVLTPQGAPASTALNPRLLAGVVAALVMWRSRRMPLSLVAGMGTLWTLEALAGHY